MKYAGVISRSALCLVLVICGPAFGQDQPSQTPYEIRLKPDLLTFGAASGLALLPVFLNNVQRSCPPCSASNVNAFDRGTAGRRNDTIDKISTGAVAAAVGWPVAAMFLDANTSKGALVDGLVTGQAVLVNVAINQMVKYGVHRPRPFVYSLKPDDDLLKEDDTYYSFYSQHTSVVFAAGISYTRTYALRHPRSRRRWVVYTAVIGGGSAVGSMRVLAGRHFPTDVLTGGAVGTSMGLLIPWLHRKSTVPGLTVVPVPSGAAVSLQVPFGN